MRPTIKELKEQLVARTAARKEEISVIIETKKIENKLRLIESPTYEAREISRSNMNSLAAFKSAIEDVSSDITVYRQFGLGAQADLIIGLVKTALFCKADYRDEVHSILDIEQDVLEDTVESLGNSAYFNPTEMILVDAIDPDIPALKQHLLIITEELGLTDVPMNKIKAATFEKQYKISLAKATAMMEETIAHKAEHGVTYDV